MLAESGCGFCRQVVFKDYNRIVQVVCPEIQRNMKRLRYKAQFGIINELHKD